MTKDMYQRAIDTQKECDALILYLNGRKKELGRIKNKILSDMDMIGVDQLRKYGAKFTAFENDGRRFIKIVLPD